MYRRPPRKNWYADLRTPTGRKQLSLDTPNRPLAGRIETMWETLALEYRAWDVLSPVIERVERIGILYDRWVESKGNLNAIRERRRQQQEQDDAKLAEQKQNQDENGANAPDDGARLDTHVKEFLKAYAGGGCVEGTVHAVTGQLRWLIPEGSPLLIHDATPRYLTQRLADYQGGPNTRRKVHTAWSVFFAHCTTVASLYTESPMLKVGRPKRYVPPVMFYELADVIRIVSRAASPAMRAVLALMYGSGIEVSLALEMRKLDFREVGYEDAVYGEVRAPGQKEHTRDRICLIADWAWQIVKAFMLDLQPSDFLWPGMHRTSPEHAHRRIVRALELQHYPLYNSRHHWAATRLRAGMPVQLVQKQLGHASPRTTLEVYGRFIPTGIDRSMWETRVNRPDPSWPSALAQIVTPPKGA